MTETATAGEKTETVDEFAARARTWLADNMPPIDPDDPPPGYPPARPQLLVYSETWDLPAQNAVLRVD